MSGVEIGLTRIISTTSFRETKSGQDSPILTTVRKAFACRWKWLITIAGLRFPPLIGPGLGSRYSQLHAANRGVDSQLQI